MWVPIDDENCMVWNWYYSLGEPLDQKDRDDSFWGVEAVKMVAEGFNPKGADTSYYDIRAVERVLPPGVNWLEALKDEMYPTGAPF